MVMRHRKICSQDWRPAETRALVWSIFVDLSQASIVFMLALSIGESKDLERLDVGLGCILSRPLISHS